MKRPTIDKQPIRVFQAQFEIYILTVFGRNTMRSYSNFLNHLFRIFPDKFTPLDFYRADISDYIIIRQQEGGTVASINQEVSVIRTFWNWMIDYKDQPIQNIATVKKLRYVRKQKNRLTLSEFSRLMSEIHDPKLLQIVRARLLGEECKSFSYTTIANKMQDACQRAGLPYVSLKKLPDAVHSAAIALLAPDISSPQDLQPMPLAA